MYKYINNMYAYIIMYSCNTREKQPKGDESFLPF